MTSDAHALGLALLLVSAGCAGFDRGSPPNESDAAAPMPPTDALKPLAGPSFDAVHDLLVRECAGCHGSSGIAAGTDLVLSGEPDRDYPAIDALVDPGDAAESPLLRKARGEDHSGGALLVPDSGDYQLVLDWIDEGAMR